MHEILEKWLDYDEDPTGEIANWYAKIITCIKLINEGETLIDGKRAEAILIWYSVNFINEMGDELAEENHKPTLQKSINLIFMVISRLSTLTYREILDLFPARIPYENGEKYFDGKDIYFDDSCSDFTSPSLDSLCLISLCFCGIYFGEEEYGTTDFDAKIGDGIMKYMANSHNPVLGLFYCTFLCACSLLYNAIPYCNVNHPT